MVRLYGRPNGLRSTVLCLILLIAGQLPAAEPSDRPLVLLVHGMVEDIHKPSEVWGQLAVDETGPPRWGGMVGALESAGYRFGGQIKPGRLSLQLPRDLETAGAAESPQEADCFWLQFSENAATDGVALKAMELSAAISQLRSFTGRSRVYLVAHSAGGLVARAYLQSAFPDSLPFRHDVERLITVATPHLGSAAAEHWGDWVGTRATSLKTTASLLRGLNEELELPADVCFAAIVVRGIWTGVDGGGSDYDQAVDHDFLDSLPVDFREGGDQVLSVRTQNLRLARCAARYEQTSGGAVQYVVARVRKDSAETIHTAALRDRQVQDWVRVLLADDGSCWKGFASPADRARWVDRQAPGCAFALLEDQTRKRHWCSGVECGRLRVARGKLADDELWYGFSGETTWRRHVVGMFGSQAAVQGAIQVTVDEFGRLRGCRLAGENDEPGELAETAGPDREF